MLKIDLYSDIRHLKSQQGFIIDLFTSISER